MSARLLYWLSTQVTTGILIAANESMFYVTKGAIKLEIQLNDVLTIVPIATSDRFEATANIIAKSHDAILNYELKTVPAHEKAEAVKDYFKRNGWQIDN